VSNEPVGLYLIVEAMPGAAQMERLRAALAAAPIASVLVTAPQGRPLEAGLARPFVEFVQEQGVAVLIDGDAKLARALRADGVHLRAVEGAEGGYDEAREILGARYMVGGDADGTRHGAMALGEAGAEYVAFDGPEQEDLIAWWAEIFEIPCIAFDVPSPEDATLAARSGADFVAIRMPGDASAGDVQALVQAYAKAVAKPPRVGA
jgi:thiamine-phosphate pyrophosphorylase